MGASGGHASVSEQAAEEGGLAGTFPAGYFLRGALCFVSCRFAGAATWPVKLA